MSDIQKKTLPPGSWPGNKGGSKTAETASDAGANVPRSVASQSSVPKDAASDVTDESGHYTHQKEKPLDNISEEAASGCSGSGAIKMQDEEASEAANTQSEEQEGESVKEVQPEEHEGGESLKEVQPEPEPEPAEVDTESVQQQKGDETSVGEDDEAKTETPAETQTEEATSQKEEPQTTATEQGGEEKQTSEAAETAPDDIEVGEEASSKASGLTEQAKQAFDLASQNQPTSEARETFLKSAKDVPTTPPIEDETQGEVPSELQQQQEDVQTQAQTQTAPSDFQTAPSEPQTAPSEPQTAPSEFQEGQTEFQQGQETAPSEGQRPQSMAGKSVSFKTPTEDSGTELGGTEAYQGQPYDTSTTGDQQQYQFQDQSQADTQQPREGGFPASSAGVTVPEHLDFSVLKDGTVNKGGNIVDGSGKVVGRVTQGILQYLIGKKCDENGDIWSENGKVIGKAEPISDNERDNMMKEPAPFEAFEDAVVDGNGMVVSNGEWVGKVAQGDLSALRGRTVDKDGDILDKAGNVIGKAERWEPEPEAEPEPEPEVDKSILSGKRVNKAGNIVDSVGNIYGRVVDGDVKKMVGRMCDKNGNILTENGEVIGRAEMVPEGEREGDKEGPFAELQGCTVAKDGNIVTPSGDIVGRLVNGDPKVLFGRAVDEDGDVLDKNGNVIGKAERWEPEPVEKKKNPLSGRLVNKDGNVVDEDGNIIGKLTTGDLRVCAGKEIDDDGDVVDSKGTVIGHCSLLQDIIKKNPMSGRRVNKDGNVVDEDGNIIGKLTTGDLSICGGKEVDDDGDVVDGKGTVIGHCSLLQDIPKEEESPEEKAKREQAEQDRKLAIQMAVCVEQCLDKIRPICKMITEKIDKAERTPEDERDEEALVREVRPLIEEGGRILTEAKGIIKGLDPDGRISANAKHKTAAREATPEEYHLADVLKDLTGDVTQCIENAKRKLEDMPHAKKELNPLWGLLNEPLFQILAAVGLLLSGVLGLVGRLLSGLGLGGLLDGLLGTLGINRVLEGLGIGSLTGSKKKKKSGGGLLGGVLGG